MASGFRQRGKTSRETKGGDEVTGTFPRALCLVLCVGLLCGAASCKPKNLTQDDYLRLANQFAGYFTGGKASDAVKMMDATMRAAMPEATTAAYFAGLVEQLGAYGSVLRSKHAQEAGYNVVYVTLAFAKAEIDMKVVLDSRGNVAGLWFGGPQVPGSGNYAPPEYADTAKFTETEVTVTTGQWQLPGTLTMPKGVTSQVPAVVLVHGSGPNDRDETLGPNKPFKDLAWGLASQGIAVLRYEKRTRQYQAQAAAATGFTVDDETVDDAISAVSLLRATAGIDPAKVFVLGHSLGAHMGPRIATKLAAGGGAQLRGVVLLAAPARDMLTLVVEQSEYLVNLDGEVTATEATQIAALKDQVSVIRKGGLKAGEAALGAYQPYWANLLDYDQVATAKALTIPILLLQGTRDYQVTMADFNLWEEAVGGQTGVTIKSYEGLNHLFIRGEGKPNPTEYSTPGNMDREVIDDIAQWLKAQ